MTTSREADNALAQQVDRFIRFTEITSDAPQVAEPTINAFALSEALKIQLMELNSPKDTRVSLMFMHISLLLDSVREPYHVVIRKHEEGSSIGLELRAMIPKSGTDAVSDDIQDDNRSLWSIKIDSEAVPDISMKLNVQLFPALNELSSRNSDDVDRLFDHSPEIITPFHEFFQQVIHHTLGDMGHDEIVDTAGLLINAIRDQQWN